MLLSKYTILQILLSCTVAHGLRPRYVYYRRQEATTVEPITVDVETEAQTIVAESISPELENYRAAEKETDNPVETTEAPEKETDNPQDNESPTEKTAESQERENRTEKPAQRQIAGVDLENQTIYHTVQEQDTVEPLNEETELPAPVELQTDPTIEANHAEPELESKPTEEPPENEAVEQKEAEPELKEQDPESEAQQNEQELEQNDKDAKIEPVVVPRSHIENEQSIIAQQDPNESEPPTLPDPIDQKDTDIAMKNVDRVNDNQADDIEVKSIISKYFKSVPDITSQYVLNEGLAKSITHYFKNKVVALPLFHINMKIDRNLVKIPWETGPPIESKKKSKSYPYKVLPALKQNHPEARD